MLCHNEPKVTQIKALGYNFFSVIGYWFDYES